MCKKLGMPRSLVYYKRKTRKIDSELENEIIQIFKDSRNNYGSRKIKVELKKKNIIASRKKIRRIMDKYGLVSNYTIKQYKIQKSTCNEEKIANEVNREFNDREYLEVVISDLTYVRVRDKWCYVCILIDLFNREIIGYSAGTKKNAELVYEAFLSSSVNLSQIRIFHTDRGCEFKNKIVDVDLNILLIEAGHFTFQYEFVALIFDVRTAVADTPKALEKLVFKFTERVPEFISFKWYKSKHGKTS